MLYLGIYDIWGSKQNFCFICGNDDQWILRPPCNIDTAVSNHTTLKNHNIYHVPLKDKVTYTMLHTPAGPQRRGTLASCSRSDLALVVMPPPPERMYALPKLQETIPASGPTLCSLNWLAIFSLCLTDTSVHQKPEGPWSSILDPDPWASLNICYSVPIPHPLISWALPPPPEAHPQGLSSANVPVSSHLSLNIPVTFQLWRKLGCQATVSEEVFPCALGETLT